jgi:hypothetical protein
MSRRHARFRVHLRVMGMMGDPASERSPGAYPSPRRLRKALRMRDRRDLAEWDPAIWRDFAPSPADGGGAR